MNPLYLLAETATSTASNGETSPVLIACGLLLLGILLLILEFFVISFGALSIAALICAIGAIYQAFQAGPLMGWAFTILIPVLAFYLIRWGLAKLKSSKLVAHEEITADAGYHHHANEMGVGEGSIGTLLTPAMPSGRAQFAKGVCDVQVTGPALDVGAQIIVTAIDGPIIHVSPHDGE